MSDLLKELEKACLARPPRKLVIDLSENNLTTSHVQYLAEWLSEKKLQLYALDLSLNRIYAADWVDILPSIRKILLHVERLHLGGNYLPALQETPALKELQQRKVAFIAAKHSYSSNAWIQGWKTNARAFLRDAYR